MIEFGLILDLLWAIKVSLELLHERVKGSPGPARLRTSSRERQCLGLFLCLLALAGAIKVSKSSGLNWTEFASW